MESSSETRYRFREGLPAFESDREFRLIAETDWHPFLVMESLRDGGPRFICIEIAAVEPGYAVELSREDAESIGVQPGRCAAGDSGIAFLGVVATVEDGALTANLAAPLVINTARGAGVQSIQPASRYSPFTVVLHGQERQPC